MPSLAVLYTTLGDIWGLPYTSEITATIMGLDVFLNALLGISANTYYKEKANQNAVRRNQTNSKAGLGQYRKARFRRAERRGI